MMQGSVVLKGPIPNTGIVPLVQAIGIGRQTNIVELFDGPSQVLGQLAIRSGKLLSVEYGDRRGLDALVPFISQRNGSFLVRSVHGMPPSEPLGDLRAMLAQLDGDHAKVSLIRNLPNTPVSGTGVQSVPAAAIPAQKPHAVAPSIAKVVTEPAPSHPIPTPSAPSSAAPAAFQAPPPAQKPVSVAPPASAIAEAPKPPAAASRPRTSIPPASATPAVRRAGDPDVPILAVASAKGGVGKTTLAMNLGVALARRGLRVTIVDTDPNGGVSASVNAHRRIVQGAFDVICGGASLQDVLVNTRMPGLRVLPAGGSNLAIDQIENSQNHRSAWRNLLASLTSSADVVLVDTAGGVYGPTRTMLGLATHVVGVLQAEPLAMRAASHFERAVASLSPAPELIGIAMNMFEPRGATSTAVLQEACDALRPGLLFDTTVPRTPIINDASLRGVIAGQGDLAHAPAVAWTFEQLSSEILERMQLARTRTVLDDSPLF